MSRRPKPIELETTIIANDPDALQAWTDATELLFRLKARRQARLAQDEKDGQGQQEQSKMESHS